MAEPVTFVWRAESAVRRWARIAFWVAVIVSYIFAIIPAPAAPDPTGWDKANHMLAFLTMAVLARPAYPRARIAVLSAGLVAFGALIEITQMIPSLGRDAELADWIVDSAAVCAGLAISRGARRHRKAVMVE